MKKLVNVLTGLTLLSIMTAACAPCGDFDEQDGTINGQEPFKLNNKEGWKSDSAMGILAMQSLGYTSWTQNDEAKAWFSKLFTSDGNPRINFVFGWGGNDQQGNVCLAANHHSDCTDWDGTNLTCYKASGWESPLKIIP